MIPDPPEKTPDESDRASLIEHQINVEAIEKALRNVEKAPEDFDGRTCIDCGEFIPPERLKTGAFRDFHCQTIHERKQKEHRK